MTPDERRVLVARALANDLSLAETEHFRALCAEDESLLAELARHTVLDRLLSHTHLYPNGSEFVREVQTRVHAPGAEPLAFVQRVTRRLRPQQAWRPAPRLLAAAAAIVILVSGTWWTIAMRQPVASVVGVEAIIWAEGQRRLESSERIPPGRVQIAGGFLELALTSGVHLILDGPADLELRRGNECFLHRGRVVARVPEAARGFMLESARGRLIDLGTEFGVSVGDDGSRMEVHVLDGLVEATAAGQDAAMRLRENEAVRFTPDIARRIPSNPTAFVTDLPNRSAAPSGFVHWSFDESTGHRTRDRGHGLGVANADAFFRSFVSTSPGPAWTTGLFGSSIYLDGAGAYLESPFTGIAGERPRTVAFWVKVPRDLGPWQGYGILNWGSFAEPGAAWQVSINPEAADGPVGRLRVGVHLGPVVGVTDLRDDRWHHAAVVMYGGRRPDVSTHVLLYLDGELEPSATKAVREIRTDTTSQRAHGIWLGRNLSFKSETDRGEHRFFRGWLDEVFIFDAALSQDQIRQLMRENRASPSQPGTR
ncbi:MAG: hypothetical protein LC804_12835 [Acidobacteria bacterium]|nr:hypothetical protein [Acidobacteriota bacterium]